MANENIKTLITTTTKSISWGKRDLALFAEVLCVVGLGTGFGKEVMLMEFHVAMPTSSHLN